MKKHIDWWIIGGCLAVYASLVIMVEYELYLKQTTMLVLLTMIIGFTMGWYGKN